MQFLRRLRSAETLACRVATDDDGVFIQDEVEGEGAPLLTHQGSSIDSRWWRIADSDLPAECVFVS